MASAAGHKARAESAELEALQHDYHEIAVKLHRDRYDRALDEAIVQRATTSDALLH